MIRPYLRMPTGFVFLVALIDVYSRYVIGWSLSNMLDTTSCIDAFKLALTIAKPEVINSDQGSQFTSTDWVDYLPKNEIKISMTGKGRCVDNIYIERFWRSFKYEEFYLNEYGNIQELKKRIGVYIKFYNHKRWHQSLDYKTPAEIYFSNREEEQPLDMRTSSYGPASALRGIWTSRPIVHILRGFTTVVFINFGRLKIS